jgi:D-ribose pyranose/furanose isomerase RbsD
MKKLNQILQSHIIVDEIPLEENHHIMYSIVILSKGRSGIPNIIGQESKIALLNLSQIKQVLINQAIIIRSGVKQNYTNITNSSDF